MADTTSVRLGDDLAQRLQYLGHKGESYDDTIRRLLDQNGEPSLSELREKYE